jgi:hypothetical protein
MLGTAGSDQGKKFSGLLKLDGDNLTMCYPIMGTERPTTLDEPPFGVTVLVLKRAENK